MIMMGKLEVVMFRYRSRVYPNVTWVLLQQPLV